MDLGAKASVQILILQVRLKSLLEKHARFSKWYATHQTADLRRKFQQALAKYKKQYGIE